MQTNPTDSDSDASRPVHRQSSQSSHAAHPQRESAAAGERSPRAAHSIEGHSPRRTHAAVRQDDSDFGAAVDGHAPPAAVQSRAHSAVPTDGATSFADLGLIQPLVRSVHDKGYTAPTPIQVKAIPPAIEGRDVLGCAQTGTGKTAAFALPILQRLWKADHSPRQQRPVLALILCPTRELASQIGESFNAYGKHSGLTCSVIFGGVGYPKQRSELRRGVDIVVATPGRLLDLMQERAVRFDSLRVLVLDEADRMLDMGFLPDVKRVLSALPKQRQTMCFSATMPPEIQKLVDAMLHTPVKVAVTPVATTADKVEQAVFFVDKNHKPDLLVKLLSDPAVTRALVFTRTKRGADRVAKRVSQSGLRAEAIHGNKSQNARERALDSFKTGRGHVLVATDIAARGIDVRDISHVINYELPNEPETYVHRIGRTARAEAAGIAWSLCSSEEKAYLKDIERLIRQKVPVAQAPGFTVRASSSDSESGGDRSRSPRGGRDRGPRDSSQRERRYDRSPRPVEDAPRRGAAGAPAHPAAHAPRRSAPAAGAPASAAAAAAPAARYGFERRSPDQASATGRDPRFDTRSAAHRRGPRAPHSGGSAAHRPHRNGPARHEGGSARAPASSHGSSAPRRPASGHEPKRRSSTPWSQRRHH